MTQQSDAVRMSAGTGSQQTPAQNVAEFQAVIKSEAKDLGRLATALGPLAKPQAFEDVAKLEVLIERVSKKVGGLSTSERAEPLLQALRDVARRIRDRVRTQLGAELRDACKVRDLEFRIISREEPIEVRIPPFAVRIHRDKGRAEILFARQVIEGCSADAASIMKAHESASRSMSRDFDSAAFFQACLRAWRAALAAGQVESTKRVEIVDFLPYLAVQLQDRKFRVEPIDRNFRGYSRARFAFDANRLREAGGFRQGGWKMSLGVATGTTASQKNRVIYFENGSGEGEYKLTVNFTRVEGE